MTVLIDTSALYAMLDEDDRNHSAAVARWRSLLAGGDLILTHDYVVVETAALVQRRLGSDACQVLVGDLLPAIAV